MFLGNLRKLLLPTSLAILALGMFGRSVAQADPVISLVLIDSYARSNPFGLAYNSSDGNMYWSNSSAVIHQMTTAGVDTGVLWNLPVGSINALAYDAATNQLATARGNPTSTIYYFDVGGGNLTTQVLNNAVAGCCSTIDGLDIDGGEIWISPDVSNVYRFDQSSGLYSGVNPFLGGAGGYSGVERVDVGANSYIIVVNDASSPRQLCVHDLAGLQLGCQNFVNQRYEDLAFDGRYLWAADYGGGKIDKFDVLSDGGSIFNPVPEPGTLLLLGTGLLGLVGMKRKFLS